MTVEASEGNYDAYFEDGMQTNYTINVTRFDDFIQGIFTGNVEGGASGEVIKSVSGSFFVKICED